MLNPNLVTVGHIGSGQTLQAIGADVSSGLGSAVAVKVHLLVDYTLLCPPGWPHRPSLIGRRPVQHFPGSILKAGTTEAFHQPEAAALVAASAGIYA